MTIETSHLFTDLGLGFQVSSVDWWKTPHASKVGKVKHPNKYLSQSSESQPWSHTETGKEVPPVITI